MAKLVSTLIAIGYLAFMFTMTHLPKERVPRNLALAGDKTLHFLAFMGLGFLASLAIQLRFSHLGRFAYAIPILLFGLAYAWFDELTQPLVGRHFDYKDLVADGAGLLAGMLLFEALRPLMIKFVRIQELK